MRPNLTTNKQEFNQLSRTTRNFEANQTPLNILIRTTVNTSEAMDRTQDQIGMYLFTWSIIIFHLGHLFTPVILFETVSADFRSFFLFKLLLCSLFFCCKLWYICLFVCASSALLTYRACLEKGR